LPLKLILALTTYGANSEVRETGENRGSPT
jgi:hypothetical protein